MSIDTYDLVSRKRALEKKLRYKIEYRRIQVIWPLHLNYGNLILSHALKNIELLEDGYVTSWDAESFSYGYLAEKIRRRTARSFQNVDKGRRLSARQRELSERIDLIERASARIDRLVKREMQKKARLDDELTRHGNRTTREDGSRIEPARQVRHTKYDDAPPRQPRRGRSPFRPIDRVVLGEKLSNTREVAEELPLRGKQEATTNKQLSVEDTLKKIEAWADDWLAGKLETDEDWNSFEDCLDLDRP